ncbi:Sulfatase [Rosistilla carotiformis]|uniref:Sulfatase n=1 Tax=Rosistilla carotiformis TaxID=2528017 RepID=A0A518JXL2_9BACT|nr:Sulfatase [Rosistilla carotiformis]
MKLFLLRFLCVAIAFGGAIQAADKPNIVVIMGDDIGWFNPSCYNHGMMGYQTPNIDRIAKEGVMFTDAYVQQSCTAGRPPSSPVSPPSVQVALLHAKQRENGIVVLRATTAQSAVDHRFVSRPV